MAKNKKKGQLALRLGLNDERIPKLFGLLCLFVAAYLFVAFFSYLFTWYIDQDVVLHWPGWTLLLNGTHEMANWLGRLGAITSNFFFYWCFGLPSFLLVYLLGRIGMNRIFRQSFAALMPTINYTIVAMIVAAVFLEFVAGGAQFPWGGAVGEGIANWLQNFVGTVGLWLLIIAVVIGMVVWRTNPNFNELTLDKLLEEGVDYFSDLMSGASLRRKKR